MADTIDIGDLRIEVSTRSEKAVAGIDDLVKALNNLASAFRGLKKPTNDAEEETQKTTKSFSLLGTTAQTSSKKVGGFFASIVRIAKYRLIRTVLRSITSALKEGIENVYQYSKATGGDFAASMDNFATSLQYAKNAIGAAGAAILEIFLPYISAAIDKIAEFANSLSNMFAVAAGKDKYTAATKKMKDFAKSVDEAKSSVLGFDELNIISGNTILGDIEGAFEKLPVAVEDAKELKTTLGGVAATAAGLGTFAALFSINPVLAGVAAFVAALVVIAAMGGNIKETFDGIFETVRNGIDWFFDSLKEGNPELTNLLNILQLIADTFVVIGETHFDLNLDVWKDFADIITSLFNLDFNGVWKGFKQLLTDLLNGVIGFINGVSKAFSKIGLGDYVEIPKVTYEQMWGGAEATAGAGTSQDNRTWAEKMWGENGIFTIHPDDYQHLDRYDFGGSPTDPYSFVGSDWESAERSYAGGTGRIGETPEVNINLTVELDGRQIESSIKRVEHTNGAAITTP